MPAIRHRLEHSLILLDDYLHPRFGAGRGNPSPFLALKEKLGEFPDGYDNNGRSYLVQRFKQNLYQGPASELDQYDDNIKRHLDAINVGRSQDEQIVLKYFQLLALLYTEHVLHRLFNDADYFLIELNNLVEARNQDQRTTQFTLFTLDDLTKLAYWMATGSGKTLLLHINYHQIQHYRNQNPFPPYENILLITPNAGLSLQHLRELQLSGIPVSMFRQNAPHLFPGTVQIIEITKFTEGTSGPQTVNIDSFGHRNLVFVDEGHRGASGDVWIGYRDKLADQGFTFEYSATFGEAFNSGNKSEDLAVRHAYGKSIIFDYSYRYFHGDGYGKDYTILNLPNSYNENDRDTLLLANLLTLYEQTWVYQEHADQLREYHLENPLLMFVGHTVQTGKTKSKLTKDDEVSLSDVLDIVRFLHRVASNQNWAIQTAARILGERSGLTDEHGVDIFLRKFLALKGRFSPENLFNHLLQTIFHADASAPLHLSNLRNAPGEISMRLGSSEIPFGVINIGDDSNFLSLAEEANLGLVIDPPDAFRGSLFDTINHTDSSINILVGAKKFAEGWSSWRVSGMGLLNVGKSEGSEVIQMFGRGVRLLGYQRSLKRSSVLDGAHPLHLPLLETLNIFSVNGDYLAQFKAALGREGIIEGYEEIYLPVQYDTYDDENPQLYIIRPQNDRKFVDQSAFPLVAEPNPAIKPVLDFSPRVQVATSKVHEPVLNATNESTGISTEVLSLLDWDAIYIEMLIWRRQRGFYNLVIDRDVLHQIVQPQNFQGKLNGRYYTLYAPEALIKPERFSDVPRVQALVLSIIKQYTERFYNYYRQAWESENLEYRFISKEDPNMQPAVLSLDPPRYGYVIKINRNKPDLIATIEKLIEQGDTLYKQDQDEFPNIIFDRHLYAPLVARGYFRGSAFEEDLDIKTVPTGLNKGETLFVRELRDFLQGSGSEILGNRRLYLLRNLSRGKGIGFFESVNFYPDFILWIVDGDQQSITFIDPKGLVMLRPNNFSHPKIQLFQTLQMDIAPRLNNSNITLDAYIISAESYTETIRYFGDPRNPFTPDEFVENHVLFPGTSISNLLKNHM